MQVQQWFRKIHLYLGVFTTPAILFFAFTGAIQTLNYNDASRDGTYKPPRWVSVLAQVHKKQTIQISPRKLPPTAVNVPAGQEGTKKSVVAAAVSEPRTSQRNPIPLKIFFILVCANLFFSTISGIYLSWKYRRNRLVMGACLAAGTITPIILLQF